MDCTSVHGILQARLLGWAAIPFSRGSSWPRNRTRVSSIAGRFFTVCAQRSPVSSKGCQMLSGQNPHSSWSFCDFPSINPHFASLSVNPSCPYSVVDSDLPPHCKFSLNKINHVAFNRCQNNLSLELLLGFLDGSVGKESSCNAGDPGSVPGSGRSPEEGIGYPLLYSGLENSGLQRVGHDWATFT